jgi:polysaccharide biosynthesis/export protein
MLRSSRLAVVAMLAIAFGAAPGVVTGQTEASYRVGVGDVLNVVVFDHTEVSGTFLIDEDGVIIYPLLGRVPVVGLTVSEIARLLERLLEKDYYVDVQVNVEVKDYRSRSVTVLGEVAKPGTVYLKGKTTLTQVLVEVGGIRTSAGPLIEVRRQEKVDGRDTTKVFSFSTDKLLSGEQGNDFELVSGDIVSVGEKQQFFISGEIARPGQYEISRDLTLLQAISQAGGLSKFASSSVEIHRDVDGKKTILEVDLGRIRRGKEEDVPIMAGDLVILKRRFF